MKKRILIVEDDSVLSELLKKLLSNDGYDTLVAHTGEEAVESAAEYQPDLILMDVKLPGIDGYQATRMIKGEPKLKDVPVIFVSGRSPAEDGGRSFEVGGAMYLRKPIHKNHLRSVIGLVWGAEPVGTGVRKENDTTGR